MKFDPWPLSLIFTRSNKLDRKSLLTWLVIIVFLAGFYQPLRAQEAIVLVGAGSSVPAPLYAKFVEQYNSRHSGIKFRYLAIGTSEGIKEISHGSGDFGAGEVRLTDSERTENNLTELPVVLIGIVPYYNLPGVHKELRFNGELLADIFLGEAKTWNSPAIAKLNPDVQLPNLPIKVVYRPGGKGTNYVFSEFLSKTSTRFRSKMGVSASPNWPIGIAAERSSDMVDKVKAETGTIGYGELQYAIKAGLQHGRVQNAAGRYVLASDETITAACRAVEAPDWGKFSVSLTNAPGADSYPITSFTWFYVRPKSSDPRRAAALTDFFSWVFSDGQQIGAQQGYSPLPQQLVERVKAKITSLR